MQFKPCTPPLGGWIGGFAESNPAFAYPKPNLSDLAFYDNMDNIDKLARQIKVIWPEFSWQSVIGDESSRCFSRFAPDISRMGYDDTGRVWSIMCPQQGISSPVLGALNIEVTVTKTRGWIDEPSGSLAADMTVEGKIWFSPPSWQHPFNRALFAAIAEVEHNFPLSKANAIKIALHHFDNPLNQILDVRDGLSPRFDPPDFTLHYDDSFQWKGKHPRTLKAYTVANVEVQIGNPEKTGDPIADTFNDLVMEAFNISSGNLLTQSNILTWNVWCTCPETVDQEEWRNHAKKWRDSIDSTNHSPEGEGTSPVYRDGSPLNVSEAALKTLENKIRKFIHDHFPHLSHLLEE